MHSLFFYLDECKIHDGFFLLFKFLVESFVITFFFNHSSVLNVDYFFLLDPILIYKS